MNVYKTILNLDVWGGLGDNLQLSTIPRRFFEKFGYKGVYISNKDRQKFRNEEIKKLVWEMNPYIAGFTDEPGANIVDDGLLRFDGETKWIPLMEKIYQFDGPYSRRPEIYYIPKKPLIDVSDKIIVDLTSSVENNTMDKIHYRTKIRNFFQSLNEKIFIVDLANIKKTSTFIDYTSDIISDKLIEKIQVNNIFEYCDIIKHCKQYICGFSGSLSLAASIRENFNCFCPTTAYHSKYFIFDGVDYILI
jgi:hypothetical protein